MTDPEPADASPSATAELTSEQADALFRSRAFAVLLILVALVGVLVSIAAWCFLELTHQAQQELFVHLPSALGFKDAPTWWPLPIVAVGALVTAFAITKLPGKGGHVPANGLSTAGTPDPITLPGVALAGLATISCGLVLGPEAPLIAIGGGLAALTIKSARRGAQPQLVAIVAAAGSFAALSFVFTSPLIAAVILIEATAIGGPRLRLVLVPGLLAAGIGTLVSLGLGHFTGLSSSAYALGALPLPVATRPTLAELGWAIALGLAIGAVTSVAVGGGRVTARSVSRTPMLLSLPAIALIIGGLAILFGQVTSHGAQNVLFSGQDQLPNLIGHAGTWSLGALLLLIALKGLAYSASLGSFRGGPTFPALFLGAAAGIMASHLPGMPIQAAVAVGMGAATVSVLRLPLSAVVLASVLCSHVGDNVVPLVIVGVIVSYVITLLTSQPRTSPTATATATVAAH